MVNHIYGRMAKDLVPALMAWHIGSRPVYLCRAGRTLSAGSPSDDGSTSAANPMDLPPGNGSPVPLRRLGSTASVNSRKRRGDTLCKEGRAFRRNLWEFLHSEVIDFLLKRRSVVDNQNTGTSVSGLQNTGYYYGGGANDDRIDQLEELVEQSASGMIPIRILTSTMPRAVETVCFDEYELPCSQMSNLNPIDKGDLAGMEMEDIKHEDPLFFAQLQADSFRTRYVFTRTRGCRIAVCSDLIHALNRIILQVSRWRKLPRLGSSPEFRPD